MKNQIIAIYSYETIHNEEYFFSKKVLKSARNNSNTKVYKELSKLHFEPNIKSTKTTYCYNSDDYKHAMFFLLGAGPFRYYDYKKFNSPFKIN